MSSKFVRDSIISYLQTETTENVIDLTDDFRELQDMISGAGISSSDPWLGVQFVGSDEFPVDIRGTDSRGKYREEGIIFLHVVSVAKLGAGNAILTRAEGLRDKFRGRRVNGTILIESVSPPNFGEGVTISFSGGYTAAVVQISYQRDLDL